MALSQQFSKREELLGTFKNFELKNRPPTCGKNN